MTSKLSQRGSDRPLPPRRAGQTLLAALVLAVLGVGGWLLASSGEPEIEVGGSTDETGIATAAEATSGTHSNESAREVDAGAAAFAKDGSVGVTDASAPGVRTRHHVLVRVIDARTRAPVAEAEVFAEPFDAPDTGRRRRGRTTFAQVREEGEKAVTDADGRAYVRARQHTRIYAQKGELFGTDHIDWDRLHADGFELHVAKLDSFVVRVVGPDGAPRKDVPIGLAASYRGGEGAPDRSADAVGDTDDQGRLEVRLPEVVRAGRLPDELEVFVAAPGLSKVAVPVALGQSEVELRLPPTGSLLVRVTSLDRQPLPDLPPWSAYIGTNGEVAAQPPRFEHVAFSGKGGEFRAPYVGLGTTIDLYVSVGFASKNQTVAGPLAAGQEVVANLSLDNGRQFCVLGKVVDAEGAPVKGVRVTALVKQETVGSAKTDAEGRFFAGFVREEGERSSEVVVLASHEAAGVAASAPVVLQVGSRHDLGELRLAPSTPVATGVVVADGPTGPGLSMHVEYASGEAWLYDFHHVVDIADDDTFAVHMLGAADPRTRRRLQVRAVGFVHSDPVEFTAGQQLRIELKKGPRFAAKLLLDPAIHWFVERSGLDLLLTGPDGDSNYVHSRLVDGEWTFESASVTPGVYTIAVESGSAVDDLAQMEGVRIFPGEAPDPRLMPWDLRSAVQMLTVRLRRADGSMFDGWGDIYRKRALDGEWESCSSFEAGIAQSLTTAVPADLFIEVGEHGFYRRSGVLGSLDLVVAEPRSVVVKIEGWPKLRAGVPFGLGLDVEPSPRWLAAAGLPDFANPVVDYEWEPEKGELTLKLSQAADVDLAFSTATEQESKPLATLTVSVADGEKEKKVAVPPAVVAATAAWIERDPGAGR